MEIKGHTVRVEDEVWAWLNALPGKTINEGLRALMMEARAVVVPASGAPDAQVGELLELVRSLPDLDDIRAALDDVMTLKIAERRGQGGLPASLNHCAHCESDYPRPAGQPPASMCPSCRAAGHWNTGNCRPCAEAKHLASVASLDQSGSGRSDIVYDPMG